MTIKTILKYLFNNRKTLFKAISGLCVGLLLCWGVILHNLNKKLSQSLETALNNIEAYLGLLSDSLLASNVLKLTVEQLQNSNDSVLHKLDSVRNELKIKPKQLHTAATQTLVLNVIGSKGVGGNIIVKDSIYTDSILYNPLTKVKYTIGNDTVNIAIDLRNELYLYVYTKREYKNKKNFFKRLFTLDFKKVTKYKYNIVNTNDLLKSKDVRIVESNN
ncbi:hypothetical protein [uncultured phage cr131_1]|uniref:Uncharacterized protein n=1 Tax=uncultured phage cr131_1 TaxID=2772093 RepID=A0A7M1RV73_9CAUD|nr:hypothetical protein KNV60_gp57 [uncultured phage cr131_1]QOR57742.1 hypothetical protein [uncultured phage cr131_1]